MSNDTRFSMDARYTTVLPRRNKLKDDDFQKYFAYKLEAWRKHFLPLLAAVPPGGAGAATRRRPRRRRGGWR